MHPDEDTEFFGDDLTEDDLAFLENWEKLGKSDTADAEYQPDVGPGDIQAEAVDDGEGIDEGGELGDQTDEDSDNGGGDSGESDQVDASKMDISDVETEERDPGSGKGGEDDHLEAGDDDSEIEDGESDLEYDDLNEDRGEEEGDDTDYIDDPSFESDTDFDDTQIEEDDGEGERGNSDEARESDNPIEHHEDTPSAEADEESDSMDAQQELEDHLKNSETPDQADDEAEGGIDDVQEDSNSGVPEDSENIYEGMPDAGEACTNHCEDNPTEDEHDGECPHCKGRIKRERELWGAIAKDMHGNDILPGDKLRVQLPISFMVQGSILTANVPNQAVDPIRLAETTKGVVDPTICWLSGRAISQFTGWHMKDANNPIWTFEKGKKIGFVEKIGEPMGAGEHGSNATEGDQLDIEDVLEELKNKKIPDIEDEGEETPEDEMDDTSPEEGDDSDARSKNLPKHQKARFENLTERIQRKIIETFGNTCEIESITEVKDRGDSIDRVMKITSRGMTFFIDFEMRRYDPEQDGEIDAESESEDEAA